MLEFLRLYGGIVSSLLTFACAGWLAFARRTLASSADIAAIETRLSVLEEHIDTTDMQRRLGALEKSIASLSAEVAGMDKRLETIEHYMQMLVEKGLSK